MGNKIRKQAKVKEPIRIRYKALKNGNQSIYLDYYYNGKREYEFLKLYLVPETSAANKEANDLKLDRPIVEVMRILGSSLLVKDNIRDLLEPLKLVDDESDELQLHIEFKFD